MELTIKQKAIDLLPTEDSRTFVKCRYDSPALRLIPKMTETVTKIVSKSIKNLGHWQQAGDEGVIEHNVTGIMAEILSTKEFERGKSKHDFRNITVAEFAAALDNGSKSKYKRKDEIVTVSVDSMIYWMNCYLKDETRVTSIKYYHALLSQESEKKEPTPEEQEETVKQACLNTFEEFKKTGELNFVNALNAIVYNYLWKCFQIKWSEDSINIITTEAKSNHEASLLEKGKSMRNVGVSDKVALDNEMKKVALKYYFKRLITEGKEIIF